MAPRKYTLKHESMYEAISKTYEFGTKVTSPYVTPPF